MNFNKNDYPLTGLEKYKKDVGMLNGIGVKTPINHLTDIKLEMEKEKTKQLELIRDIKRLELKLKNNKKYKHDKKYIDLTKLLSNDETDLENVNDDNYDTISMETIDSINTIEEVELIKLSN